MQNRNALLHGQRINYEKYMVGCTSRRFTTAKLKGKTSQPIDTSRICLTEKLDIEAWGMKATGNRQFLRPENKFGKCLLMK